MRVNETQLSGRKIERVISKNERGGNDTDDQELLRKYLL